MDSKHIKVYENQQIEKIEKKNHTHSDFYVSLTIALCPVPPGFVMVPQISRYS